MSNPNINLNYSALDGRYAKSVDVSTLLAAKASTTSPVLTGSPETPTAALGTNTAQIASTSFVQAAKAGMVVAAVLQGDELVLTNFAGSEVLRANVRGAQGTPGDITTSYNLGTISAATLDLSSYTLGGVFRFILATNVTSILLPAQSSVQRVFELVIKQDTTGSRTITYPSGTLATEGLLPVMSTAAGVTDKVVIVQDGANTEARLVARSLS